MIPQPVIALEQECVHENIFWHRYFCRDAALITLRILGFVFIDNGWDFNCVGFYECHSISKDARNDWESSFL